MLILKQSHQKNSSEIIAASLLCLEKGGVIALPTDTIYGLAADYFNSEAKEKIFLIKKRPQDKILPVFFYSIENAEYKRDVIIDLNGEFDNSERLPSTVLDLTKWPPKVIREGAFSAQELQKTLNML